jgi:hypothetical protein
VESLKGLLHCSVGLAQSLGYPDPDAQTSSTG